MHSFKIVFSGTSDFSAIHLNSLIKHNYNIVSVLTKLKKKRNKKKCNNPVEKISSDNGIPTFVIEHKNSKEIYSQIKIFNPDIIIVVDFGCVFSQEILTLPSFGCINVHGSLLPRWRGPAPIQRALLSGDVKTGITIIKMDCGIDTGPILFQKSCKIQLEDTSETLLKKLGKIGSQSLPTVLEKIISGEITYKNQDFSKSTYARRILKHESKINWNLSAEELLRHIHAFNPWPGSYFFFRTIRIKVWEAEIESKFQGRQKKILPGTILSGNKNGLYISTGNQKILVLKKLQLPNRKIMSFSELSNSKESWFFPGQILL